MFPKMKCSYILVFAATCCMTTAVLHGFTENQLSELFQEYEIVDPTQVDYQGNFVSYDLRSLSRKRRSVINLQEEHVRREPNWINLYNDIYNESHAEKASTSGRSHYNHKFAEQRALDDQEADEEEVAFYYNITAFGSHYHLQLHNKKRLIESNAKSVWYTSEGSRKEDITNNACVHTGHIRHHPGSTVALTSCDGLAGLIKTKEREFFIEPIESRTGITSPGSSQRHVVYQRSSVKKILRKKREVSNRHGSKRASVENIADEGPIPFGRSLSHDTEQLRTGIEGNNQYTSEGDSDEMGRNRRHAKKPNYSMEILLTADDQVIEFHGREHVENYLITLLNIVDEIYHDDSIGTPINIVLVRLAFLDQRRSESLIVYKSPSKSLTNVCEWANDMQAADPLPSGKPHDHAIFLTRRDFGPAGYAHVVGMCHSLRSCTLNHEDGFSSAFVVAHETGHVLGMEHDGEGNKCGDETGMGSIMAPLVQAAFHRYHWSRCSQQEVKKHLSKFDCLLDTPQGPDWGPTPVYPGVLYSMDDQCRFDFGPGYKRCTAFRNLDVCKTLWCSHDDNPLFCKTKNGPPVDGTECGNNMWCFKGHCVWRNNRQVAVDGNWGSWSSYGACSRPCGTGVMYRNRECNKPEPSGGGRKCTGKSSEVALCNKRSCPGHRDYRADQCRSHRKKIYENRRHNWLPHEIEYENLKCELFCVSKETNDVVSMGTPVADGTRCSYDDPHSICINAACQKVGCDKIIGSNAKEDECGVCRGDGSQCRRVNGTYKKLVRRPLNSYMKMFSIPVNARKIRIEEQAGSGTIHMIAMKNRRTSRYILNQRNKMVEADVKMHFIDAGTRWSYTQENEKETVTANGPLSSEITVLLITRARDRRPNIHYSYTQHSRNVKSNMYRYEIRKWNSCSVTCGNGTRASRFFCRNKLTGKWVKKFYCSGPPPAKIRKPCTVPCALPPRWYVGEWGACSKSCGISGVQTRKVVCYRQNTNGVDKIVSDRYCQANSRKPASSVACKKLGCPPTWRTGSWSTCSVSCGKGIRRRMVVCRASRRSTGPVTCSGPKPPENNICIMTNCSDTSCAKDKSRFCELDAMSKYCSIPGFRKLCCQSCKNYNGVVGRKAFRQLSKSLNISTIEEIVDFQSKSRNVEELNLRTVPQPEFSESHGREKRQISENSQSASSSVLSRSRRSASIRRYSRNWSPDYLSAVGSTSFSIY